MALNFLNDGYFAGKVGIGTVSPLGKLHVKHVGEIYTSLAGSDSAINFLEIQGNPWRIGNRAADDSFRFAQSSDSLGTNVRVTFANGGNVGIGTVSPSELLELKPASGADSKINILKSDGTQKALIGYDNANGGLINLYNEAGTRNVVVRGYGDSYFNAGNVGIGTTSPASKLHVEGNSGGGRLLLVRDTNTTLGTKLATFIQQDGTNNPNLDISSTSTGILVNTGFSTGIPGSFTLQSNGGGSYLAFNTNSANERMRIDSNGNVGIGTTSPGSKLQISTTNQSFSTANGNAVNIAFPGGPEAGNVGGGLVFSQYYFSGSTAVIRTGGIYGIKTAGGGNFGGGLVFYTQPQSAADMNQSMILGRNGELKLNQYSGSLKTGTPTYILGTDSSGNVVKVLGSDIPGVPGGSGTVNHIPKWTPDGDTLGNSVMFQSGNNISLGITTPNARLSVVSDISIGTSGTDVLRLHNESGVGTIDGYSTRNLAFGSATNGEVVRIDNINGRVGIGTTSPGKKLEVVGDIKTSGTGNTRVILESGGACVMDLINAQTEAYLRTTTAHDLHFRTTDTNRMVIKAGGNVGIGTTSPGQKLQVSGGNVIINGGSSNNLYLSLTSNYLYGDVNGVVIAGADDNFRIKTNGSERVRVIANGNVGIGTTSPSQKLQVDGSIKVNANGFFGPGGTGTTDGILSIDGGSGTGGEAYLRLMRGGTSGFILNHTATAIQVRATANIPMFFYTNDTIGIKLNANSTVSFPEYGAGTLVTDASGNITVSSGGGAGGPFLPLAGGTMTGDLRLNDGVELELGSDADIRMYHDNSNGYINSFKGDLYIRTFDNDKDIIFQSDNGSGGTATYFFLDGGGVLTRFDKRLRMSDAVSLQLGSNGNFEMYHLSGNTTMDNFTGNLTIRNSANDKDISFACDNGSGGAAEYFRLDGSQVETVVFKDFNFEDNVKAKFGGSADLQIYHDSAGADSVIQNNTGDLEIQNRQNDGDIVFKSDDGSGGVATYIRIDGGQTRTEFEKATQHLDNIIANFGSSSDLQIYHNATDSFILNSTGDLEIINNQDDGDIIFKSDNGSGGTTAYLTLDGSITKTIASKDIHFDGAVGATFGSNASPNIVIRSGLVTATTFSGDLNGTINTATTAVTQVDAVDNETVATTAYVNNKIQLIPAGLVFQGTWNAATNTPTLTSGSGTTGHFYIVSVSGNTNLDGITDWKVGDWAVFIEQGASDQWEKIDNSSVLDGFGTGQTLPLWSGSGTSNTLTDSHITQNSALSNDIIIPQYIRHTGDTNTLFGFSQADNFIIQTNNANALTINSAQNATFAGSITVGSTGAAPLLFTKSTYGGMDTDAFYRIKFQDQGGVTNDVGIGQTATGNLGFNITAGKDFLFNGGTSGNALTLGSSNATFSGSIKTTSVNGISIDTGGNAILTLDGASGSTEAIIFKHSGTEVSRISHSNSANLVFSTGSSVAERMRITSAGNVGIGTTSPNYKLSVSGGIEAGGVVTYSKVAGSLSTTGYAIAGLTTGFNGASAGFEFKCYGGTGHYQRISYSCFCDGTTWRPRKMIDEGSDKFDVTASADGATITFTFKTRSGTQGYSPRVVVQATGHSINSTYA